MPKIQKENGLCAQPIITHTNRRNPAGKEPGSPHTYRHDSQGLQDTRRCDTHTGNAIVSLTE